MVTVSKMNVDPRACEAWFRHMMDCLGTFWILGPMPGWVSANETFSLTFLSQKIR